MSLRINIQRQRMTTKGGDVLPKGYIECNWLQSNYRQYIDTGIVPLISDTIRFSVVPQNAVAFWGAINFTIQIVSPSTYWRIFDSRGVPVAAPFEWNKRIDYIYAEGKFKQVGYDKELVNGGVPVDSSFYLFRREENLDSSQCKIISFEIEGRISLIPALDQNGKPCMFDTISKTPLYNQGIGEFGYETKDGVYVAPVYG